jgi:hypothetical protein
MRALSTLCKSLLICFTSSTVKSTHFLLISTPLKMGGKGAPSRLFGSVNLLWNQGENANGTSKREPPGEAAGG